MDVRNGIGDRAAPCTECDVWFIEDVAAFLRLSRSTIERRRRARIFPIPELPPVDHRPRWSRRVVQAFLTASVASIRRTAQRAA
jgi:hypothetical protein